MTRGATEERGGKARFRSAGGEVLLEAIVSLPLILVVVLALGQQFGVTSVQMNHVQLATELMLGAQGPSIRYDRGNPNATPPVPPSFQPLDDALLDNSFMKPLRDTVELRAPRDATVWFRLGYLHADGATGLATSVTSLAGQGPTMVAGAGVAGTSACRFKGGDLDTYANAGLAAMQGYSVQSPLTSEFAPKLYGVKIGNEVQKGYISLIPFLFVLVCSEPVTGLWSERPVSTFTLVPRRLLN